MPWTNVMPQWKAGTLKSGGSGKPVTNRKQAIAILLSEKRRAQQGNAEYQPTATPKKKKKRSSVSDAFPGF